MLPLSSEVCRSIIITTARVLIPHYLHPCCDYGGSSTWPGTGTEPNLHVFLYLKPNIQVPASSLIWVCHTTNRVPARPLPPSGFLTSLTFLQWYFPVTTYVCKSLEANLSYTSFVTTIQSWEADFSSFEFVLSYLLPLRIHLFCVPSCLTETAEQPHISRNSISSSYKEALPCVSFSECPWILLVMHFCHWLHNL